MVLTVSSWFNEPKINFKFSHKVRLFIRKEIIQNIMKPLGLLDSFPDKFINLNVTTRKSQSILEVKLGPKWSKRNTHRNHGLWFPYHQIVDSDYPLREYVKCYMDSLPIIFKEFGVTMEQVNKVRDNCEKNLLNNKNYEMSESDYNTLINEEKLADKFAREID